MWKVRRTICLILPIVIVLIFPNNTVFAKPPTKVATQIPAYAFFDQSYIDVTTGRDYLDLYIIQGVKKDSGVGIAWSSDKKSVSLVKGKGTLKLTVGQQIAFYNGKRLKLEGKVRFKDGAIIVPYGVTSKTMGLKIRGRMDYESYVELKKQAAEEAKAIAQHVTKFGFTISSVKTDEVLLDIWGNVKSNAPMIIGIQKDGELPRYKTTVPKNNELDDMVYLSDGPGKYSISLYDYGSQSMIPLTTNTINLFSVNLSSAQRNYLRPTKYVESNHPEIKKLALEITKDLKDDFAKTKAIHDWVAENIEYDYKEFFANDIGNYTAFQILQRKMGVCDGYAKLTAALNRAVGIKAKIIFGMVAGRPISDIKTMEYNHAWVETYINGKWIIQDTTWDVGRSNPDYFNPSQERFVQDHLASVVTDH